MNKTKTCPRILTSIALIICMLLGMVSVSNAEVYTNTLYPLGSNNRSTRTVSPEEHTIKIYISGGKNGSSLKKDSLPSWITVNTSYSDYYLATVKPNTNTSNRSGSILFTKGSNKYELYVTQKAFKITNSSGNVVSSLSFKIAGESKKITSNYACSYTVSNQNWLSVSKNGNNYTLTARPNMTGSKRTCTVTFTKALTQYNKITRVITISQGANYINSTPSKKSVSNEKSSFSFSVTTGYGRVTAKRANNYSWLSVSQNGNTITVSYEANTTLNSTRSGDILVTLGSITKKCTVTQAKCRSDIIFNDSLQKDITDDVWSKTRASYLERFYNGMINGANNTSKPAATRFVVNRANTISNFAWTPKSFAYGYRETEGGEKRDFDKDHTYYGLPYQQTDQNGVNTSDYFYYGSVKTTDAFKAKVNNPSYGFGNRRSGKNGAGKTCWSLGPKCGIDCSSFVSYCIGAKVQQSSKGLYNNAKTKYSNLNATMDVQPGDILWRSGHVLLVASVVKEDGKVKGIVLLESRGRTTASGRCLYVFYDSDAVLRKMFGNMSFSECRSMIQYLISNTDSYPHTGTVSDFINGFNSKHTLLKTNSISGLSLESPNIYK